MNKFNYIQEILNGFGMAIIEKNNTEIVINYPIKFIKKNMKFYINSDYKITANILGTFLTDFLNCDFSEYDSFYEFFMQYSLSLIDLNTIEKLFKNDCCEEKKFKDFIMKTMNKNQSYLLKLQQQLDMILDYCLIHPRKKVIKFTPLERLYMLRLSSPKLTILTSNKINYYKSNTIPFLPTYSKDEFYSLFKSQKSSISELNLILPQDISSILYTSLVSILSNNVYLKSCKNCNKYFVATNKSYEYCNNIIAGTNKTCREIGRRTVFNNNINNDYVLNLYYKVYSRKCMMKSRNPDISKYVNEFNTFKTIGKKKLSKYKNGELSSKDFEKWINKFN